MPAKTRKVVLDLKERSRTRRRRDVVGQRFIGPRRDIAAISAIHLNVEGGEGERKKARVIQVSVESADGERYLLTSEPDIGWISHSFMPAGFFMNVDPRYNKKKQRAFEKKNGLPPIPERAKFSARCNCGDVVSFEDIYSVSVMAKHVSHGGFSVAMFFSKAELDQIAPIFKALDKL